MDDRADSDRSELGGGPYRTPIVREQVALARLRSRSAAIARRFARRRRWATVARDALRVSRRAAGAAALAILAIGVHLALLGEAPEWLGAATLVVAIGGGMWTVFSLSGLEERR